MIKTLITGLLKGITGDLVKNLKSFKVPKNKSDLKVYLDINNDGKIDINDLRAIGNIKWENIAKIAGFAAALWLSNNMDKLLDKIF